MDSQDNKRKWKNRDLLSSLDFALTGIFTAIKEERNMRKHAVTSLLVLIAGIVFQVSRIEWLFLLLSIFLVIAFEILNSAIENVVDLASIITSICLQRRLKTWLQVQFLLCLYLLQ